MQHDHRRSRGSAELGCGWSSSTHRTSLDSTAWPRLPISRWGRIRRPLPRTALERVIRVVLTVTGSCELLAHFHLMECTFHITPRLAAAAASVGRCEERMGSGGPRLRHGRKHIRAQAQRPALRSRRAEVVLMIFNLHLLRPLPDPTVASRWRGWMREW